ncbi:DNA-directed RNA polymerase subunit alpha C-terminal domain-containing protein [Nocardia sp. IFM 10818]
MSEPSRRIEIEERTRTFQLPDRPNAIYRASAIRVPGGPWTLAEVTVTARDGQLSPMDVNIGPTRLAYYAVNGHEKTHDDDIPGLEGLPVRLRNLLRRHGLHTAADVFARTDAELAAIEHIGGASLELLRAARVRHAPARPPRDLVDLDDSAT